MEQMSRFEEQDALLDAWTACREQIARLEAEAADLLAAREVLFERDVLEHQLARDSIRRSMIAQYTAAGRLATGTVETAFDTARALTGLHPAVHDALRHGRISAAHAREITRVGRTVDEAINNGAVDPVVAALFDAAVLVVAEQDSPAKTGIHARQVLTALLGETVQERHRRARSERCVTIVSIEDGLARLTAILPEHLAFAIRDRLDQLVREILRAEKAEQIENAAAERAAKAAHTERAGKAPRSDAAGTGLADDTAADADSADEESAARDRRGAEWMDQPPVDPDTVEEFLARIEAFLAEEVAAGTGVAAASRAFFGHTDDENDWYQADPERAEEIQARWDTVLAELNRQDEGGRPGGRTLDQIRADLFTDLLLGADPTGLSGTGLDNITARIQVTIAATTLTGADDNMAFIDGVGPVHPDIARDLASRGSGWSRLFLDPTGMVVETDAYSPTDGMRAFLRARDQHCRFPGCRRPAAACEIDHNRDHALGGPTHIDNLGHFCPAHHQLKHPSVPEQFRWTACIDSGTGAVFWTAPDGRDYTAPAPRRVMFV
ncbi:HNH endonuclease signature motif containing protein [Microbacterium bovistercoris]|uniref:HNH endonuclease signature motif containing protein n=1 Tax=Microbacterium bovistercoris TaxID=2293570 RepID=UPI0015F29F9B|nr:HNH endonuclease signature motif containing protein [Microbacterium bovistercoris]